jgi:hypothetical protein
MLKLGSGSALAHYSNHDIALGYGELFDRAEDPIAQAISSHRINFEIVARPLFKVIDAYTEERRCVLRVQPERRFGGLSEATWICTVMHNSVMHRRAAGVANFPSDNCQIFRRQLDLRPFDDP